MAAVAAAPARFPPHLKSNRLRRIRLASFPFVVVYREHAGTVRVLLLKHERRAPGFGAERRCVPAAAAARAARAWSVAGDKRLVR